MARGDVLGRARAAPAGTGLAGHVPDAVAGIYIVATLTLFIVHLDPFHDLTSVSNIEASSGGNALTQIVFSLLGLLTLGLLVRLGLDRLRGLVTRPLVLMGGWFVLAIPLSVDPALSARRAILLAVAFAAAAAILVAARSARHFATLLGGTALVLLAFCFVSLLLVPDLATHTALDLREPEHAGAWRGFFSHKNEAGAAMAIFVITGLYVMRVGNRALGLALTLGSLVFLAGTFSKTPMAMLPLVLATTWACRFVRNRVARAILLLGPLVLLLTFTVGIVLFPPVKAIVSSVAGNVNFTGRTDLWDFASENIRRRPLTGWGYGAFWKTDATLYGAEKASWVNQADQAHNAYLDVALMLGLPGLLFTILLFCVQPLRDFGRAAGPDGSDPSAIFFARIWLYALLTGAFESIFYDGNNSLSVLLVVAVFGLRLAARHGVAPDPVRAPSRDGGAPPRP